MKKQTTLMIILATALVVCFLCSCQPKRETVEENLQEGSIADTNFVLYAPKKSFGNFNELMEDYFEHIDKYARDRLGIHPIVTNYNQWGVKVKEFNNGELYWQFIMEDSSNVNVRAVTVTKHFIWFEDYIYSLDTLTPNFSQKYYQEQDDAVLAILAKKGIIVFNKPISFGHFKNERFPRIDKFIKTTIKLSQKKIE